MNVQPDPSRIHAPLLPRDAERGKILDDLVSTGILDDAGFVQTALALQEMAGHIRSGTEKHFQQFDLSQGRFSILQMLYAFPDRCWTPAALADSLRVTRATVTDLLRVLERNGWLQRKAAPDDGRVAQISLTRTGRRRFQQIVPQHFRSMSALFATWSRQDHEQARLVAHRVGSLFADYRDSLSQKDKPNHEHNDR